MERKSLFKLIGLYLTLEVLWIVAIRLSFKALDWTLTAGLILIGGYLIAGLGLAIVVTVIGVYIWHHFTSQK